MLNSISKITSSLRELNNIKNIWSEAENKSDYSNDNRSIIDSDLSLSNDIGWDKGQPNWRKEKNILYSKVNNSLKDKNI